MKHCGIDLHNRTWPSENLGTRPEGSASLTKAHQPAHPPIPAYCTTPRRVTRPPVATLPTLHLSTTSQSRLSRTELLSRPAKRTIYTKSRSSTTHASDIVFRLQYQKRELSKHTATEETNTTGDIPCSTSRRENKKRVNNSNR